MTRSKPPPKNLMPKPRTPFLSVTQAALRLGLSPAQVRLHCARGTLPAERVGSRWLIREADLGRLRRLPPGRPRKKA